MNDFSKLPDDAVVNLKLSHPLMQRSMFKVSDFADAGVKHINSQYKYAGWDAVPESEVLIPGNSYWKKGRIRYRVVVEFCSSEED